MAPSDVRLLKQKRTTLKSQITALNNYIDKNKDDLDLIHLKLRFEKVKENYNGFDDIHSSLQLLEPSTENDNEKETIDDSYFDLASRVTRLSPVSSANAIPPRNSDFNSSSNEGIGKRKSKLPKFPIPTFDGKYEDWVSFKDSFEFLINSEPDLTDIEKLHFLKSAVVGDAARKISIFSITGDNYKTAWYLLEKTYNNKRIIISRHLTLLLNMEKVERESVDGLCKLADQAQQHMKALENLGVIVGEEIVVKIVEQKLPKFVAIKWDETLKRDQFPTLNELTEFIYGTAARMSIRKTSEEANSTSNLKRSNPKASSDNNSFNKPILETSKVQTLFTTTRNENCKLCKEKHPLFKCEKFRKMSVQDRTKVVKDAGLCKNCLRESINHDCKFGNCVVCNKRHNTLLHNPTYDSKQTKKS